MKQIAKVESLLASLPEHDRTVERWESELATAKEGVAKVAGDDGSMDPRQLVQVRREAAERAEVAEINFQRAEKAREDASDSIRYGIARIGAEMVDPLKAKTHEREMELREILAAAVGEGTAARHRREIEMLAARADEVNELRMMAQILEGNRKSYSLQPSSFRAAIDSLKRAEKLLGR